MAGLLDLAQCGYCGKAFVGAAGGRAICPDCEQEVRGLYDRVRLLISDQPNRMMYAGNIAERLGVSEKEVLKLVDCGLISYSSGNSKKLSIDG
ncbi:hypothetical protein FACS1894167_12960 [Synergistales bacterium]|nr:hypothetical protein FACS1894167_12960 [Synergistales bacterium]GHV55119.1 hypothetical protein FACS1894216_16640 [Synergistales bacterium]